MEQLVATVHRLLPEDCPDWWTMCPSVAGVLILRVAAAAGRQQPLALHPTLQPQNGNSPFSSSQ